ncbi:hypothetical protein [Microbacterium amylolyticum]|uniref:Fido (Protein-threonine AMPylation protein) n=1 Tax=Microbacterium amylolyticum TaxID=936337 RepID=A0ABS4ZKQ8_9MICO|nr:hypothetical protein [Microbacterium amylolyticum]MBP2437885.1 fido (protein-threonine AMPylation protein) [Microbacterium amylolyticum]
MATGWEAWESYFYPETIDPETHQGTLRNKFGERDPDRLEARVRAATADRLMDLADGTANNERTYGLDHLRAIHRYLFQDVYDWASRAAHGSNAG